MPAASSTVGGRPGAPPTAANGGADAGRAVEVARPRWSDFAPADPKGRWLGVIAVLVVHAGVGWALLGATQRKPPPAAPREPILIQQLRLTPPPAPAPGPVSPAAAQAPEQPPKPPAPPPRLRPVPPPQRPPAALPARSPQPAAELPPAVPVPAPAPVPVVDTPGPAPSVRAPAAPVPATPAPAAPSATATLPPALPATRAGPSEIGVACPTQVRPEMPRRALQDGLGGVVRAQALIRNGSVVEVTILSGPRIFHAAVRAAMLQYRCVSGAEETVAVQEFAFRVE